MEQVEHPVYDSLADVYNRWLSGDESADQCLNFYLQRLRGTRGNVLELGVGTGRIFSSLAQRGVRMIGLDHSLAMLHQASGIQATGSRGMVQGRFQDLPFRQAFSVVICPMRTVGHLLTPEDQQAAFAEVFRVLKPGGYFIFDHYNIDMDWAMAHDGRPRIMYAGSDPVSEESAVLIWDRYDYDYPNSRLYCTVTIEEIGIGCNLRSSRRVEFEFRWFSYAEVRDLAIDAGFAMEACYGDFMGSEFTLEAKDMVWILRKPARGEILSWELPSQFLSSMAWIILREPCHVSLIRASSEFTCSMMLRLTVSRIGSLVNGG